MMKYTLFGILIAVIASCQSPTHSSETHAETTVAAVRELALEGAFTRIALGSCNHQDSEQDMWQFIVQNEPQLWIWLGDNIYGDSDSMAVIKAKYDKLKQNPEYQKLLAQCPVIATWDDHDFGRNDAGTEYEYKAGTQQLMLDFIDEPAESSLRKQEGIYSAYSYGEGAERVKIILLDARYHRDSLRKDPDPNKKWGRYIARPDGTILGEAQWQWLEAQLKDTAMLTIIGSGIQFIPEDHGFEKWANMPHERTRLFELIAASGNQRVILLSGDRHISEISKLEVSGMKYPLYELTASGMTHSWPGAAENGEPNQHRVSPIIGQRNFGLIDIAWDAEPFSVKLRSKGLNDTLHMEYLIEYE